MREVIVTDLTRFKRKDKFCTAVIDVETGECFRPMPYLTSQNCIDLNIQPGTKIKGTLTKGINASSPHVEDSSYSDLVHHGEISSNEFKEVLERSLSSDISSGFGYDFPCGEKHIPVGANTNCSIIPIKVLPKDLTILEDQFNAGRIKACVEDSSGKKFNFLSITDRGFYDYALEHYNDGSLSVLQNFIKQQTEIYLRLGVSRVWDVNGKNGYWLQVNGIYTFPDFLPEVRAY